MRTRLFRHALIGLAITILGVLVGGGVAQAAPYGTTSPTIGVIDPTACESSQLPVTGQGFTPATAITVSVDGTAVTTVTTSASGDFSTTLALTSLARGQH